jgi:hypothetical protein
MVFDDVDAVIENNDVDPSKTNVWQLFKDNFWGQGMFADDAKHQVSFFVFF